MGEYTEAPSPHTREWSVPFRRMVNAYTPSEKDKERAAVFKRTRKYFRDKRKGKGRGRV